MSGEICKEDSYLTEEIPLERKKNYLSLTEEMSDLNLDVDLCASDTANELADANKRDNLAETKLDLGDSESNLTTAVCSNVVSEAKIRSSVTQTHQTQKNPEAEIESGEVGSETRSPSKEIDADLIGLNNINMSNDNNENYSSNTREQEDYHEDAATREFISEDGSIIDDGSQSGEAEASISGNMSPGIDVHHSDISSQDGTESNSAEIDESDPGFRFSTDNDGSARETLNATTTGTAPPDITSSASSSQGSVTTRGSLTRGQVRVAGRPQGPHRPPVMDTGLADDFNDGEEEEIFFFAPAPAVAETAPDLDPGELLMEATQAGIAALWDPLGAILADRGPGSVVQESAAWPSPGGLSAVTRTSNDDDVSLSHNPGMNHNDTHGANNRETMALHPTILSNDSVDPVLPIISSTQQTPVVSGANGVNTATGVVLGLSTDGSQNSSSPLSVGGHSAQPTSFPENLPSSSTVPTAIPKNKPAHQEVLVGVQTAVETKPLSDGQKPVEDYVYLYEELDSSDEGTVGSLVSTNKEENRETYDETEHSNDTEDGHIAAAENDFLSLEVKRHSSGPVIDRKKRTEQDADNLLHQIISGHVEKSMGPNTIAAASCEGNSACVNTCLANPKFNSTEANQYGKDCPDGYRKQHCSGGCKDSLSDTCDSDECDENNVDETSHGIPNINTQSSSVEVSQDLFPASSEGCSMPGVTNSGSPNNTQAIGPNTESNCGLHGDTQDAFDRCHPTKLIDEDPEITEKSDMPSCEELGEFHPADELVDTNTNLTKHSLEESVQNELDQVCPRISEEVMNCETPQKDATHTEKKFEFHSVEVGRQTLLEPTSNSDACKQNCEVKISSDDMSPNEHPHIMSGKTDLLDNDGYGGNSNLNDVSKSQLCRKRFKLGTVCEDVCGDKGSTHVSYEEAVHKDITMSSLEEPTLKQEQQDSNVAVQSCKAEDNETGCQVAESFRSSDKGVNGDCGSVGTELKCLDHGNSSDSDKQTHAMFPSGEIEDEFPQHKFGENQIHSEAQAENNSNDMHLATESVFQNGDFGFHSIKEDHFKTSGISSNHNYIRDLDIPARNIDRERVDDCVTSQTLDTTQAMAMVSSTPDQLDQNRNIISRESFKNLAEVECGTLNNECAAQLASEISDHDIVDEKSVTCDESIADEHLQVSRVGSGNREAENDSSGVLIHSDEYETVVLNSAQHTAPNIDDVQQRVEDTYPNINVSRCIDEEACLHGLGDCLVTTSSYQNLQLKAKPDHTRNENEMEKTQLLNPSQASERESEDVDREEVCPSPECDEWEGGQDKNIEPKDSCLSLGYSERAGERNEKDQSEENFRSFESNESVREHSKKVDGGKLYPSSDCREELKEQIKDVQLEDGCPSFDPHDRKEEQSENGELEESFSSLDWDKKVNDQIEKVCPSLGCDGDEEKQNENGRLENVCSNLDYGEKVGKQNENGLLDEGRPSLDCGELEGEQNENDRLEEVCPRLDCDEKINDQIGNYQIEKACPSLDCDEREGEQSENGQLEKNCPSYDCENAQLEICPSLGCDEREGEQSENGQLEKICPIYDCENGQLEKVCPSLGCDEREGEQSENGQLEKIYPSYDCENGQLEKVCPSLGCDEREGEQSEKGQLKKICPSYDCENGQLEKVCPSLGCDEREGNKSENGPLERVESGRDQNEKVEQNGINQYEKVSPSLDCGERLEEQTGNGGPEKACQSLDFNTIVKDRSESQREEVCLNICRDETLANKEEPDLSEVSKRCDQNTLPPKPDNRKFFEMPCVEGKRPDMESLTHSEFDEEGNSNSELKTSSSDQRDTLNAAEINCPNDQGDQSRTDTTADNGDIGVTQHVLAESARGLSFRMDEKEESTQNVSIRCEIGKDDSVYENLSTSELSEKTHNVSESLVKTNLEVYFKGENSGNSKIRYKDTSDISLGLGQRGNYLDVEKFESESTCLGMSGGSKNFADLIATEITASKNGDLNCGAVNPIIVEVDAQKGDKIGKHDRDGAQSENLMEKTSEIFICEDSFSSTESSHEKPGNSEGSLEGESTTSTSNSLSESSSGGGQTKTSTESVLPRTERKKFDLSTLTGVSQESEKKKEGVSSSEDASSGSHTDASESLSENLEAKQEASLASKTTCEQGFSGNDRKNIKKLTKTFHDAQGDLSPEKAILEATDLWLEKISDLRESPAIVNDSRSDAKLHQITAECKSQLLCNSKYKLGPSASMHGTRASGRSGLSMVTHPIQPATTKEPNAGDTENSPEKEKPQPKFAFTAAPRLKHARPNIRQPTSCSSRGEPDVSSKRLPGDHQTPRAPSSPREEASWSCKAAEGRLSLEKSARHTNGDPTVYRAMNALPSHTLGHGGRGDVCSDPHGRVTTNGSTQEQHPDLSHEEIHGHRKSSKLFQKLENPQATIPKDATGEQDTQLYRISTNRLRRRQRADVKPEEAGYCDDAIIRPKTLSISHQPYQNKSQISPKTKQQKSEDTDISQGAVHQDLHQQSNATGLHRHRFSENTTQSGGGWAWQKSPARGVILKPKPPLKIARPARDGSVGAAPQISKTSSQGKDTGSRNTTRSRIDAPTLHKRYHPQRILTVKEFEKEQLARHLSQDLKKISKTGPSVDCHMNPYVIRRAKASVERQRAKTNRDSLLALENCRFLSLLNDTKSVYHGSLLPSAYASLNKSRGMTSQNHHHGGQLGRSGHSVSSQSVTSADPRPPPGVEHISGQWVAPVKHKVVAPRGLDSYLQAKIKVRPPQPPSLAR